jgi:anthranilate synthase/aminodeoxychorismate synthase-like glutamine amidotransferase
MEYVRTLAGSIPVLGVCLGHQVIAAVYGGVVDRAPEPRHGKTSPITHDGRGVFAGLSNPFEATRYHSLAVIEVPADLQVTARSEDGVVQGLRHRDLAVEGVQFHPESVMTGEGKRLLANFLAA